MDNFAAWLLGIRAEQPLEYMRLRRIRRSVYREIAQFTAEIIRSKEPIPFAEIDHSEFRPLRRGAAWGGVLDCAWIRITGEVPVENAHAIVMFGLLGEGLAYDSDGEVLDSVSRVFQQGDQPHSGNRFRPVRHVDQSSGRVEFYVDVTYNGWLLYPLGRGVYHGAHLAVRDDDAFGLYYDYLTLVVLADSTEDKTLAAQIRRSLRRAYARFTAGDFHGAREALAFELDKKSDEEFVYSAIGHGHLDMAWLWPLRETHRKSARTYARAMNLIDIYDDYIYGTSQPQQLFWIKQEHPELYAKLQAAVARGRLELQGSFWVETDTNMPGGESLVRQSIVGRRFLAEEFGLTAEQMRMCWLPDTFGYSGNLPQILKKSGMDWFQTIKLSWNKVTNFPFRTFHWEGIDGSRVLVHMPPEGEYNSRGAADGLLRGLAQYPERDLNTALLVYGSGDGGGGPNEIHLEMTRREQDLLGLPKIEYSKASDFFQRLEERDVAASYKGELYLQAHQGTYTTQAHIKRYNRIVERKLHEAEVLAAIVGEDCRAFLEPHWRDVLLGHFHDILPGSGITRVAHEAVESLLRVEKALDEYVSTLIARLPRKGTAPSAINLTSMHRREHVSHGGDWYDVEVGPYAAATLEPANAFPEMLQTTGSLTNGLLTLRFGKSGEILSCIDAKGNEQSATGLNRIVLHRDPYQFPFDAWDIGQKYTRRTPRTLRPGKVDNWIDGPRAIRRQVYRFGRSTIEQHVILEAGSDLVRFETMIDWHEKHKMLRAEFRPVHYGESVKCEIQFGHVERTTLERTDEERAEFEVCAHKWIATQDDDGGFALLNDSKYGHRAKSGLMSLNLLRSPTFPDKTADRGNHLTTYAFRPFAVGDLESVIRDGYRLNNPLRIEDGVSLASVASVDNPDIIIETIKPAENGAGTVIRLYESLGRAATTALSVSLKHKTAHETNLLETPSGLAKLDRLQFEPFEIKTILLQG
jgi:alpha-mannosidase